MNYKLSDIALWVDGVLHGKDQQVSFIFTDSRNTEGLDRESALFVAIVGPKRQGSSYIPDLIQQGFKLFITEVAPVTSADVSYIITSNPLEALQKIAAHHRSQFRFPIIGITGSNGKTMVKEWIWQLLKKDFNIIRSPGSFNSQLGVPLSLLSCEKSHQLGLFEAGISQPGEMEKLEQMIHPDLVILNHIGPAHDEGFVDRRSKILEKLKLASRADYLIYSADDPMVVSLVKTFAESHYIKTLSFSFKQPAGIYIHQVKRETDRSILNFIYKSSSHSISIPFTDDASVENAAACLAALIALERLDPEHMQSFLHLQPVSGRLEQLKGKNDCILINDSYNSDLHSFRAALSFLNHQNPDLRKTVILSDMEELGIPTQALYPKISELLLATGISRLIGIGPEICQVQQLFTSIPESAFYTNTDSFISNFNSKDFHHEIILIKGARRFRFEEITELLRKQNHLTKLEINLTAVTHNLNIYRQLLPRNTKLMVMVKAFSYGSGSFELARLLQYCGVDYLAVAYPDEGIELRKAGITTPIMIMNAEPESARLLQDYQLEPVIYSSKQLLRFIHYFQNLPQTLKAHLEFETGMNRLGISDFLLDDMLSILQKNRSKITIQSAFTHLASSEDVEEDTHTAAQIKLYKAMYAKTCAALNYPILSHVANSAGIARFNGFECNMARLGLGLHGIDPSNTIQDSLEPVSTLKTYISQIKSIHAGASVGYNRSFIATNDMQIGVIGIGYADGLRRALGNGIGGVYIQGVFCPIVGKICMDMCMVDLGTLIVSEGEEVVVFENSKHILAMAEACETNPYEILTGISERISRIYIQNA